MTQPKNTKTNYDESRSFQAPPLPPQKNPLLFPVTFIPAGVLPPLPLDKNNNPEEICQFTFEHKRRHL